MNFGNFLILMLNCKTDGTSFFFTLCFINQDECFSNNASCYCLNCLSNNNQIWDFAKFLRALQKFQSQLQKSQIYVNQGEHR